MPTAPHYGLIPTQGQPNSYPTTTKLLPHDDHSPIALLPHNPVWTIIVVEPPFLLQAVITALVNILESDKEMM